MSKKSEKRAAKKARQRKRKAAAKVEADRCAMMSEDKSFGATILKTYAHMEWNGSKFTPAPPAPSPRLEVKVTLMSAAYKKLGIEWSGAGKRCTSRIQPMHLLSSFFFTAFMGTPVISCRG